MLKSVYIYRSMFLEKEGNNIGISIGKEEATGSNPVIGSTNYQRVTLKLLKAQFNLLNYK